MFGGDHDVDALRTGHPPTGVLLASDREARCRGVGALPGIGGVRGSMRCEQETGPLGKKEARLLRAGGSVELLTSSKL